MPASHHEDWRAFHESLEHADCRPVAHWPSTDRAIDTGSTETSCARELSYRPAACHDGSAQRTSIKSSRGRIPERHRRLTRRHVPSMPGLCSQTAYIFRRSECCPRFRRHWIRLVRRSCRRTSVLPPCLHLSVTSRASRVSRRSQALLFKRTSRIRRIARMPLGTRSTRGQRATLIKWIARVSLTTRKTRIQRSSRHPRAPRTPLRERPLRRPMVCRSESLRRLGLPRHHLSVFQQPAISAPP
jgi:hypothetical protein